MAPTTRSQNSSLRSSPAPTSPPSSKCSLSTSSASTPSKYSKQSSSSSSPPPPLPAKPRILILGTGWSGFTLAQRLSSSPISTTHQIVLLSPHRTMALTPLLASAACGIFDFRIAEEPVRRLGNAGQLVKYQVKVERVDLGGRRVWCRAVVGSNGNARLAAADGVPGEKDREGEGGEWHEGDGEFEIGYDTLILAPGSETNTFGTPGVLDCCLTMKSVQDAMRLRESILDCFELASLPVYEEAKKKELLHFVIVGGGPTGVELAAEIDELVHGHLLRIYPDLQGLPTISVYDVADRMLGQFGEKLSEYAMEKFRRRDVRVCTKREIKGFERGVMEVKDEGEVKFGVAVWCAGNKATSLVENLDVKKSEGAMQRVFTDKWLRVLKPDKEEGIVEGVYALGDAADIEGNALPPTAEVALQKAEWLAKHLNEIEYRKADGKGMEEEGFKYHPRALVLTLEGRMVLWMEVVSGRGRGLGLRGGVAVWSGRGVGDGGV